ncbi:Predicted metal-dependent hydrolase, TIM-barrel fold [Selenomonas ruminantium]|uniref:Predicted metal-dependent hydrolase, TIM-barrel fold n=1 Tax=Selenomonas ruminantium TaxID=971 RepID=A0A1M6VDV6_SELRU|nr:amidohydrolase family protein [Selenomonas ruminantium]SHK79551.1 Predicted metal-dependent hydrolase, TIM-barrel fold [Selenomonas ruminantium]
MKRRDFLKVSALGALALLGTGGGLLETAAASPQEVRLPRGRKIDMHAHAMLPSYLEGLKELGIDAALEEGYPLPKWSEEAHLAFMSEAGIDYTVLSQATPHIYNGDEKLSCKVARRINVETAALCQNYPDKFGFAAALPFPAIDGSIEEIAYAMDELGAIGVKVPSNAQGIYLGDERWEKIFAELDRRKALVIVHPSPAPQLPRQGTVTGRVMALYEYPADTTRAMLNLLASGMLERYPRIKLVVPHCGSFLPYMKQRAKAMFAMLAGMKMMEPVDMEKSMGNLYFDLAGDPMPDALDMLLKITDQEHILYGSDYPYVPAPVLLQKKAALDRELAQREWLEQIYCQNSQKLIS